MIEITADMAMITKRAILSFVATVNEDGTPNLSPKASLTVRNGILYFADIKSPTTIRNLRRNAAIEINVVDIFLRRGYRFKGLATLLSPGHAEYSPSPSGSGRQTAGSIPSIWSSRSSRLKSPLCYHPLISLPSLL